ncbi:MAG TPA: metalloregulator ArsR/SmtB family transcription factor [Jatrophihabitans sp.]|nr:metalloregulator ArsR/SmtB family transcription factor [Jatrophihabitans sp.]
MGHGVQGNATPVAQLTADSASAVAETLQALASPSRLLILSRLRQGPATVSHLTDELGLEQPTVSHQLRLLRMMGLVVANRTGRNVTYALFDQHVASLLDEAVFHAEHVRLGRPDADAAG